MSEAIWSPVPHDPSSVGYLNGTRGKIIAASVELFAYPKKDGTPSTQKDGTPTQPTCTLMLMVEDANGETHGPIPYSSTTRNHPLALMPSDDKTSFVPKEPGAQIWGLANEFLWYLVQAGFPKERISANVQFLLGIEGYWEQVLPAYKKNAPVGTDIREGAEKESSTKGMFPVITRDLIVPGLGPVGAQTPQGTTPASPAPATNAPMDPIQSAAANMITQLLTTISPIQYTNLHSMATAFVTQNPAHPVAIEYVKNNDKQQAMMWFFNAAWLSGKDPKFPTPPWSYNESTMEIVKK